MVFRSLQTYDGIQVPVRHIVVSLKTGYNYFSRALLLRPFQMILMILSAPMYLKVLPSLYSYFRFCFRHIQTYSSIIQEDTHAYSEPCVFLTYSEYWHIPITKDIPNPRYIHNTLLNIFTKAPFWTFDTFLNAPFFCRCYLTSTVSLWYL